MTDLSGQYFGRYYLAVERLDRTTSSIISKIKPVGRIFRIGHITPVALWIESHASNLVLKVSCKCIPYGCDLKVAH